MNIVLNLNENDINKAVLAYVAKSGIDVANKDIDVDISVGRKGSGPRAEVTLTTKKTAEDYVEICSTNDVETPTQTGEVEEEATTEGNDLLTQVANQEEEESPVDVPEETRMFST